MVGEIGLHTFLGQLPMRLLTEVLRVTRREVAKERLYDWLGVVSDPALRLPESDRISPRFDLEWNREALNDLIVYGVETCLRTGEDCMGLVDRRLFGAGPFDYGRWCLEMAIGAEHGKAASFYLRELLDCINDGSGADGLTVEGAAVALAADQSLLKLFAQMRNAPLSREVRPEQAKMPDPRRIRNTRRLGRRG